MISVSVFSLVPEEKAGLYDMFFEDIKLLFDRFLVEFELLHKCKNFLTFFAGRI